MKYIRTKDDVFCFENNFILKQNKKGEVLIVKPNRIGYFRFNIKDIIKQANTIKELCDGFVVEDNCDFAIFSNLKLAKQTKGNCYGAIWTDKGLIYVAKMNEKGELELL